MLGTCSNVSWQIQIRFFRLETRYKSVEIRMVFSLKKTNTQNTSGQSLLCTPCNKTLLDTEIERARKLIGI